MKRGKRPAKLPINPRSDEIRYDIENAQVYVINVRPLKNAVTHPKKENVL